MLTGKRSSRKRPRIFLLVWCAVALLAGKQAAAVCPPPESRRVAGPEPFRYALALAESLAQAKLASSKAPAEAPGRDPGPDQELSRLVNQLKSAAEDYQCAAELVAPYAKSSDEGVALSAQAAAVTYGALIQLDDQKTQLIQSVLDRNLTRGNLAGRLERGRARSEETWRTLISATVMGTFALVQPPEQEAETVSKLRISDQQRTAIADRLERDFGAVVREEAKRGETPLVGAARLLFGFVSNTDWESSDAR